MIYLKELGFTEEDIDILKSNLPEKALFQLQQYEQSVKDNLDYLKTLKIDNYKACFEKFYNMFLLDTTTFKDIFSKYDPEDLKIKLEKNVAIMEYL